MSKQFTLIQAGLEQWSRFDTSLIDWYELSSWPSGIRLAVLTIFFMIFLSLSGFFILGNKISVFNIEKNKEHILQNDYQVKYTEAANLTVLKQQVIQMKIIFEALISQLPSETEVPALLEDVTHAGVNNGLLFKKIELNDEVKKDFYVELPITIEVSGSYHDLAAFVSGVSSLSRIVTLHDFDIWSEKKSIDRLSMTILAKTYRYKNSDNTPLSAAN